MRELTAPFWL
jgi:hypothetical protein